MLNEIALGLGVLVVGVVAASLAWPWLAQPGEDKRERREEPALAERRETVLSALRDLDFDHAVGKVADEDYGPLRQALVIEAAALLSREDEAAAAIRTCAVCGRRAQAGDLFCPACGADLDRAPAACPSCGGAVWAEDLYCRGCGRRLQPALSGPQPAPLGTVQA